MRYPLLLWGLLISATIGSYTLAESSSQPWAVALILALTSIKALLIIDGFMELQGVRHLVRRSLHLYCPLLAVLIWSILQF